MQFIASSLLVSNHNPEKFVCPDLGFVIAMLYPTHARTQDVRRLSFIQLVQDRAADAQAPVPSAA